MTMDLGAQVEPAEGFDFRARNVRWGVIGEGPRRLRSWHALSSVIWRRIIRTSSATGACTSTICWGYGQSEMREGQNVSLGVQTRSAALLEHWNSRRLTSSLTISARDRPARAFARR